MNDFSHPIGSKSGIDEEEVKFINKTVSVVLASGMFATVGFYLAGLCMLFVRRDPVPSVPSQYFHSIAALLSSLGALSPRPFLYFGTVSLIMTPVMRVFVSIIAFWKEKDKKYVIVTVIVMIVVIASAVVGTIFKVNVG